MSFYRDDAPVPAELRTAEFLLRPLRATDAERDYEAVMASEAALRRDNGDRWPRPDFTVEENRASLQGHEADFRTRRGFTYTVLDPSEGRCLGCIYIYPPNAATVAGASARVGFVQASTYAFPPFAAEEVGEIRDNEAEARFWVRPDGVVPDLDRKLLAALVRWLRDDFAFARVRFRARADDERRTAILGEAGLRVVGALPLRETEAFIFG